MAMKVMTNVIVMIEPMNNSNPPKIFPTVLKSSVRSLTRSLPKLSMKEAKEFPKELRVPSFLNLWFTLLISSSTYLPMFDTFTGSPVISSFSAVVFALGTIIQRIM